MLNDARIPVPTLATDRFETLFEQAPFSLQILAPDGRTLRVNKAWEELWQATEDIKAWVFGDYNVLTDPQLEAKGVTARLRQAFAGTSVEVPAMFYDPAEAGRPGRARWVRAAAHPIKNGDGSVREVMLIHEDVTGRMQSEEALRSSELRLKQLANTIPQLAWMADPDGSIHWYNERWYAYTGTTFAQMEGWGWQSVHDPQVLPTILEQWQNSLATGDSFEMTFPLRGADGHFRPFLTLVAPLKDDLGRVVQWFGTNTDVSALQEAERRSRVAEERLRLAVRAGNIGIWDWDLGADTRRVVRRGLSAARARAGVLRWPCRGLHGAGPSRRPRPARAQGARGRGRQGRFHRGVQGPFAEWRGALAFDGGEGSGRCPGETRRA